MEKRNAVATAIRFSPILLCLLCLVVPLQAQNQTVRLSANEMTVRQAISELGEQTGKYFGFSSTLNVSKRVRFENTEDSFGKLFDTILGTDFTFAEDGNYILIYHKSLEDKPETGFISGRVIDDNTGEPVAGAIILIVGNNTRLVTNASGYFRSPEVPKGNYVVKFSLPGDAAVIYREMAATETPLRSRTIVRMREFAGSNDPEVLPERLLVIEPVEQTVEKYYTYFDEQAVLDASQEPSEYRHFTPAIGDYQPGTPRLAVKTNALWWGVGALNAEGEVRLADRWTVSLPVAYSPWESGDRKRRFWVIQPEVRYWFGRAFERHSVGLHASYGSYKIGHLQLPFPSLLEEKHMDGRLFGAGASYGYHMPLGVRWGVEFSAGVGFVRMEYDQYSEGFGVGAARRDNRYYFGPTKLGVSLVYIIR